MREVEHNGKKYKILEKLKWKHTKDLTKFGKDKLNDLMNNPEILDYMVKNFVVEPKLTDEILDNMDTEDVLFLIFEVQKVKYPKEFLSELKKKLS